MSKSESYLDSLGPFSDVVISLLASIAKLEREKVGSERWQGWPGHGSKDE